MKIKILNELEVNRALKEDDSSDPSIRFELEITELIDNISKLSIGEVNGYFLTKAIDYIEQKEIYDDYDGFSSDSQISFEGDDGTHITYKVSISLKVEN
jgi:hypothetical protein